MSAAAAVRVGAISLAAAAAGVLLASVALVAVLELDDGRHDIFGRDLPPTVPRVQPPRGAPLR